MAKVKLRNIPYRGSAPALQDLLAGNVDLMFDNLGVSLAMVNAGKLKLLAVASPQRLPSLPNVPTVAETLPGFESAAWYAFVAPPKTPKSIVDRINTAEIFRGSPEKASVYMREEVDRWGNVIKAANIKLQ
jgi:tripartite-type tricarboxylate transporter receptor subunit TctC